MPVRAIVALIITRILTNQQYCKLLFVKQSFDGSLCIYEVRRLGRTLQKLGYLNSFIFSDDFLVF